MKRGHFIQMMTDDFKSIVELNQTKGHDYAGEDDALSNFKKQADDLGLTPEQIWGVYAGKHYSAILTFIREGDVKSESIEGRIHDLILYGFLLLGLVREKMANSGSSSIDTTFAPRIWSETEAARGNQDRFLSTILPGEDSDDYK